MGKSLLIVCSLISIYFFTNIELNAGGYIRVKKNYLISLRYYSSKDGSIKIKNEILFLSTPKNFSTIQPLAKGYLDFTGNFTVLEKENSATIFVLTYRVMLRDEIGGKSDKTFKTSLEEKANKKLEAVSGRKANKGTHKEKQPPSYSSSGTINIIEGKNMVFYSIKKPASDSKMQTELKLEISISTSKY